MDSEDYQVGYGRPPEHTRFKPNQSGNPNGRPPRANAETLLDIANRVLDEDLTVTDHAGRRRRMTKREAFVELILTRDAKPNAKAADTAIKNRMLRDSGALTPPPEAPQTGFGVLAVGRYLTPEEWEAKYSAYKAPLDPVALLHSIDAEALAQAMEAKARLQREGYDDSHDCVD